jgi:hypothetical protein
MATKKKSFDAVKESRRWRKATSKLLSKMTPKQQIEFLNRRLDDWRAAPAPKRTGGLARR